MSFPSEITPGTVLKLFVSETNPPKLKRFVVIGCSQDEVQLATVYINSQINKRISYSIELECLHFQVISKGRSWLDHDSWIDCSDLIIRETKEILSAVRQRPEAIIGKLSTEDFAGVIRLLKTSRKIKGKTKKRFGLYDG